METIFIYTWFVTIMSILVTIIYFLIFIIIDLSVLTARRINWVLRVLHIQSKFTKEEIDIIKVILEKYDK